MRSALAEAAPSRAGRAPWRRIGLGLALLLVVGVLLRTAGDDGPPVAPTLSANIPRAPVAAAVRALDDLVSAVSAGDVAAAEALAPAGNAAARAELGDLAANAAALRVEGFDLSYLDATGTVSAAGAWTAAVDATWQLAGFDNQPARAEILVGLVAQRDRVAVSGVGAGDRRAPVWMTDRVRVRRMAHILVIDAAGDGKRIARLARAAVPVVRRVLPRWRAELVVQVPVTAAALDQALDAAPGTYAAVAAVTASADGSNGAHVFVNPRLMAGLGEVGAQVVISHEAAHVASDASDPADPADRAMPLWLLEGFADYVALRDIDLPVSATAAQILERVRRDGIPGGLPGLEEFEAGSSHLGAAYEGAWLACVEVVEAGGQRALVSLYRAVDRGDTPDAALRRAVGFGEEELVRRWQERLTDLTG